MTTTTLSSKSRFTSLLAGMLKKNRASMLYIFVLSFFFFPLQYILETSRVYRQYLLIGVNNDGWVPRFNLIGPAEIHTGLSMVMVFFIFMLAALVLALANTSYMHNRRAVDVYHSLPVSRGTLLTANAASSFLTVAIPMVVDYLIILVYGAFRAPVLTQLHTEYPFVFLPGALLMDCFGWLTTVAAIVAVTTLVATQVSNVFENLLFTGEVLAAVPIVIVVVFGLFSYYLPGYCYEPDFVLTVCSSPALVMFGKYVDSEHSLAAYNIALVLWALLSAGILWLAGWLYARRPSERAESIGRGGLMSWLCKGLATFLGAAGLGALFSALNNNSDVFFVIGAAVGAVLVCLLMEAILNRGFHGIRRVLPVDAILCAGFTVLAVALVLFGSAFALRLPAPAAVESVTINYRGKYDYCDPLDHASEYRYNTNNPVYSYHTLQELTLADPAAVQAVIDLHKDMGECAAGRAEPLNNGRSILFEYTMKNGTEMKRRFSRISEAGLAALLALESQPDFYDQTNPVFACPVEDIQKVYAAGCTGLAISESSDPAEIAALLEALRADMQADADPNNYALPKAYLTFDTGVYYAETDTPLAHDSWSAFSVAVQPEYTRTLAALSKLTGNSYAGYDFSAVNEIGVSNNGVYSTSSNYAVARRVTTFFDMSHMANYSDREIVDYGGVMVSEPEQIAELLALAKTADGIADWVDDGVAYSRLHYVYLHLCQTDGQGFTQGASVLVDYDDVPDWLLAQLFEDPAYYEKYGYDMGYYDVPYASAVEYAGVEVARY